MKTPLRLFYDGLLESQWWPAEKLQALQRRQLTSLLNHARATSPFYRYRLNGAFRPNGSIDWDNWTKIPIVTRADVSANFDSLLSRRPVKAHGPLQDVWSSGSTGDPVTVRTTSWLNEMTAASYWRAQQRAGLDWSRTMLGVLGKQNHELGASLGPWGPFWMPEARAGRLIYTTYDTDNIYRLELMQRLNVAYLATTPGGALLLAEAARAKGIALRLQAVLTRGATANPYVQDELAAVFDARTIEMYSSKECGTIGHPCSSGGGWHVNAESMLVEVLDDSNEPVAAGEEGRAVITPFGMTAMPLIRYDQGDRIVQGEPCACGRGLPHFLSVSGRVRDRFFRPNGELILGLPVEARKALGAGRWQEAQVGESAFEIRYVPRDWGVPRNLARFSELFYEHYYPGASYALVEVDDLALNANGKFKERVIEWHGHT